MKTQFTPGPWEVNIGGGGCNVVVNNTMLSPIVVPINPDWLVTCPELTLEAQANTKLIAAAPELFAALTETLQLLDANAIALALQAGKEATENSHPICRRARSLLSHVTSEPASTM